MLKLLPRVLILSFVLLFLTVSTNIAASFSGAIFTSDSTCNGVDLNIYANKDDVYLNGGPAHPNGSGIPDGQYYVKVTTPNGDLLGTSVGSIDNDPIVVVGGEFSSCYQLSTILIKASDSTVGYDVTTNPAGEYKVWLSSDINFSNAFSKTDNFKVKAENGGGDPNPENGVLSVIKFYDANANGINDDEFNIEGWKVRIQNGIDYIRFTPAEMILTPDTYTITESTPIETNWMNTTTNPVVNVLENGGTDNVEFGNLCLGEGGARTLGFWSNKNGQALMDNNDLAMLSALNLKNANGVDFDPTNYSQFRTWILGAKATNMAYMLSAQLAAAELNVYNGLANSNSLVYAPGVISVNSLGFATLGNVMNEANSELAIHSVVSSASSFRTYQTNLKSALDNANNNTNFVQATPCAFTFN